jgi:hypothetical protein
MSGGSVLLVLVGVALLVAALFKGGSSAVGWALFKVRLTRLLLVVGAILLIIVAVNARGGTK